MTRPPRFQLAKLLLSTAVCALMTFTATCALSPVPAIAQDASATPAATAPSDATPTQATPAPAAGATPVADPAAAPAAPAAPATESATTSPAAQSVRSLVEEFWHYGKVARYDLAVAAGQKVLSSGASPADVLVAFEQTAADRKDNLDEWFLRWQDIDAMKDVTNQLSKTLNEGRYTRRSDPAFITANIDRLTSSERGYINGIRALRDSGELAVPFLIQYMHDPNKSQYQPVIRRALRDLGRYALNPLVAATEAKDPDLLAMICTSLGDLGYDVAVPYLSRVVAEKDLPPPARNAATDAIQRIIGAGGAGMSPADLFYTLGEKFYYDTAAITADSRNAMADMWFWNDQRGLTKLDVPPSIFNELMAMRECEYSLRLGGSQNDALSLWLASNYKREVELPQGAADPTRAENQPDAHYYGVSAGAQYLNVALARALKDHNSAVALKVITSLQDIAGQSNALPDGNGPLIDAMSYPDRVVRYEAAFAVAGSLPQKSFNGQNRVVPLLAEALSQTGQPSVLLAAGTAEQFNALSESLKAAGFLVAGGTSADAALGNSETLPSIDVVIVSDDLPPNDVDRLLTSRTQSPKVAGAAKLVMVKTGASPYEERKNNDPMISTTQAHDAAALRPAIDEARRRAGALPIDPAIATQYSTRAGELLARLAISRGQVLDLSAAQPALLAALNDPRPDIVKLSGLVLGLVPSKEAQIGLVTVAGEGKTSDDVKISLYKSLATNAKFFGDMLDESQVSGLTKVVADAKNLTVRSAAAEAHGALNLPADQAKSLIVDQAKM